MGQASSGGASQRFSLNTRHLFPKWAFAVMLAVWLPFGGILVVFFALDVHLAAALVPLGIVSFGLWLTYSLYRGYRNPQTNFVELQAEGMKLQMYEVGRLYSAVVSYIDTQDVCEVSRHRLQRILPVLWPYPPENGHVDITLRRPKWLLSRYSFAWPWVKKVHLDVERPAEFVAELQARLEK